MLLGRLNHRINCIRTKKISTLVVAYAEYKEENTTVRTKFIIKHQTPTPKEAPAIEIFPSARVLSIPYCRSRKRLGTWKNDEEPVSELQIPHKN